MNDFVANVLIVDDSESNLDVLSRRITRLGHKPFTAADGSEAMVVLGARSIDLVLLDIMMPNMNGFQVLGRIKDDPELRHIPVIVISAVEDIASTVKCIELGAEDYLTKPFNPQILQARITASLEKKRLRDIESDYLEEQAVTQRVSRELNARLNFRTMAEITLSWAMERTVAHLGLLCLIRRETSALEVVAIDGDSPVISRFKNKILDIDSEEYTKAIKTFMPQVSSDGATFLLPDSKSRFVFPIGRPGQVISLLILENRTSEHYSKTALTFLTMLTDRAGTAMMNAFLYEAVNRANMEKAEFISDVSHELKNPMTNIQNYAKLIAHAGQLNDDQANFLNIIVESVHRMRRLVADLGDISRLETGFLRLEREQVDVTHLVDGAVNELRGPIQQKGQSINVAVADNLPPVMADRSRIIQVMVNLVSNAHKYTNEGGEICIRAATDPKKKKRDKIDMEMITIAVQDNGIGIREEDQERVFNKYWRAADPNARGATGTGLGLSISKQLIEMHGGEVWFESVYGEGTTFYFSLPVAQ